jgi:hypothetical protein
MTCGGGGTWRLELTLQAADVEEGEADPYHLVVVDTDSGATLAVSSKPVTYADGDSHAPLCGRDCQVGEMRFNSAHPDG